MLCGAWEILSLASVANLGSTQPAQLQSLVKVECCILRYTVDRRVASSNFTAGKVNVLCPSSGQFIHCLVLVQPRKTGNRPEIATKLLTWT